MTYVRLEDVWKEYEVKKAKVQALKGLNMSVEKGEFVVVLGPSGEGKSTLLKVIAGLLRQERGDIYLRGELVDDVPPKDRKVSMVPQNYAIYPFMSVFDNISFSLRLSHVSKEEIRKRVMEVAKMLRIDNLLDRKPSQLSGGQIQRVAIARALVKGVDIILMDEPLSNLDAQVRVAAREELKQLQREFKPTIIYVTHDQIEALSLGSKLAVLYGGKIKAYGDPMTLYREPNTVWVASFVGSPSMNLIKGFPEGSWLNLGKFRIPLPDRFKGVLREGQSVLVGIRPEDVEIDNSGSVEGVVEIVEELGHYTVTYVRVGEEVIRVIERGYIRREVGDKVRLNFDLSRLCIFDGETETNVINHKGKSS